MKASINIASAFIVCVFSLLSCSDYNSAENVQIANRADSIIFDAGTAKQYQRMRELADSFEAAGEISMLAANRWRGVSYYREGNYHMSEICYRMAIKCPVKSQLDEVSYIKVVRRLSELLLLKGDYEESLRIAIDAIHMMEKTGTGSDIDYAILLNNIGCCQLNLGRDDDANESFLTARGHYANRWESDSTGRGLQEAVVGTIYTSMAYINTRRYNESIYWIDRTEMLLKKYQQKEDARIEYFDEYTGIIEIMRAVALQGQGKKEEAAKAYQAFLLTDYSGTDNGRIHSNDYLIAAERYDEAADNYRYLDKMLIRREIDMSLDNIQLYMLPKYKANALAGRRDSARVAGERVLAVLDSAITNQKKSTTAELATIYDTNQKDAQISKQQAEMAVMRWITTLVLSVLLTIFFTIYTLHRRKAQRHLRAAYQKLEEGNAKLSALNTQLSTLNAQLVTANAKAEESSKMKTNFIQQISHEIRTPLNILSGFTQIITTPGMELDDATRADINNQINENTGRITGLVNKMLELSDANSQSDIERKDNVLAIQIAAQAAEESHINEAKHLTFDLQISQQAEMAMLQTNDQQATRALVLLLDNAIKFTRQAEAAMGNASAAQAPAAALATVRLCVDSNDGKVIFAVEDTGIGVPPEQAERIFEEFVQLDDYYDGTGIGLTVARSITRRLGGDIVLDTNYSPGARFVMTLPA